MVTRLILVNIAVFVSLGLLGAIMKNTGSAHAYGLFYDQLSLPGGLIALIKRPWTIISYMFMHTSIGHIFWNLLIYFWFGRIFGDLMGDKRILPVYLLSGLTGAIFFLLFCAVAGFTNATLVGASAAVLGTVIAAAVTAPDYQINMLLIGRVPLKYIAAVIILIDLIALGGTVNKGGHIAHLGGISFGWLYVRQLQNGVDLGGFIEKWVDGIKNTFQEKKLTPSSSIKNRKSKSPLHVSHKREIITKQSRTPNQENEEKVNEILDKITQRGIESLTDEEKIFLESSSK